MDSNRLPRGTSCLTRFHARADGVFSRANYKGVFDALLRISRNEGITALWAGCTPTVVRAMALNFGQLAFFSEAKTRLKQLADSSSARAADPATMTDKERRLYEMNRTRVKFGLQEKQSWLSSPQTQTLAASAIAGFFASFFSLPFDFVKTRYGTIHLSVTLISCSVCLDCRSKQRLLSDFPQNLGC
jgi:hypothetical protein